MPLIIGARGLDKLIQNEIVHGASGKTFASIGTRGAYCEKNFLKARSHLQKWIQDRPEYETAGEDDIVFW